MDVKLVMFKANGQRKNFSVTGDLTIVGRGDNCDLRVPLTDVSRQHCELRIEDDRLVVADLGSSNGTFVNNKRVSESRLRPGDLLTLGPVSFVVQIDGKPVGVTPPDAPKKKAATVGETDEDQAVALEVEVDDAVVLEEDDQAVILEEDDDEGAIVLEEDDEEAIVLDEDDDTDDSDIFKALRGDDEK